ncbi:MAG: hypothetical protein DI535_05915 [Citrobacter freundii]|nr:MAG: hypothetical protein DI535_05915 [Citrobacter freundii]
MPTITQLAQQGHGFAVFPEVRIFDKPTKGKSIQHLIVGDFITPPKNSSGKYEKWSSKLVKGTGDKAMIKQKILHRC